jgi:hypothetical protein
MVSNNKCSTIIEPSGMRPSGNLGLMLTVAALAVMGLSLHARHLGAGFSMHQPIIDITVSGLGLTDIVIATEARYTRHPAVSDPLVPFMDHPGAVEHFPTGSFWMVPPQVGF